MSADAVTRRDRGVPVPGEPLAARIAVALLAVYVVYACAQLDVSWERVAAGLAQRRALLRPAVPAELRALGAAGQGPAESLEIAVLASALGIVLALPIGLAAARNLMPAWVSWPARSLIVASRARSTR